jgi:hypothetical protein
MPYCPKCACKIKEQVNYCPNCGFPVADLFQESQQPVRPPAAPPVMVKGFLTAPITVASILCLLIGVGGIILSFALFGLAIGIGGRNIASSTSGLMKVIITVGSSFGVGTGILLLIVAIIHLVGWYWLWGVKLMGGVVGIVAGLIDVFTVIFGMIWLSIVILPPLGLSLLAVPFLLPILVVISLLGMEMLIMIALGWQTLE